MNDHDYVRIVAELWDEIQEGDQEVLDALERDEREKYESLPDGMGLDDDHDEETIYEC
jgi:hypothetical protein